MAAYTIDLASEYSIRRALREEGRFSEDAINHAMRALFPTPGAPNDSESTGEWRPGRLPRFEPTAEDWKGYADWFDGVEAQWDRDLLLADRLGSTELRATIEDAKERLRYERTCNARFV